MTAVPKPVVIRDPKYLAFLRTLPCHFQHWGNCDFGFAFVRNQCEASHFLGRNDDSAALPLCPGHHRTNAVAWHRGEQTFCMVYSVTKAQLVGEAKTLYAEYHR